MKFLPRTVYILGLASFLTDCSSEMIYPLLPVFLTAVLGAGAFQLGLIEGVAESASSILKIISGVWTDRLRIRKPFLVFGYSLSGFARPLVGVAQIWPVVLFLRFADRVGKGLRTSPRDALIADVTGPHQRGRAYGLHRAMDHAGAAVGPLITVVLLSFAHVSLRHVFLLAVIPAILVVILLVGGVKEAGPVAQQKVPDTLSLKSWSLFPRDFKVLMMGILIFTLGNSTDAFFLLRLSESNVSMSGVALLWSFHSLVKMASTYVGGRLADRVDRGKLLVAGWMYYALIYLAFALISSKGLSIAVFLAYGVYYGLTEPTEKAMVSLFAPKDLQGTAFGFYHGVVGLAALPASFFFGLIWKSFGAPTAFITGAALAGLASFLLISLATSRSRSR